jgi:hypothetical protein
MVTRPRALLQTYRAELGLLHDMIFFEADPQVEASPEVHHDEDPVLDGSILR